MATTATKVHEAHIGNMKFQVWDFAIGASDTSATWKCSMQDVKLILPVTDSAEINGTPIINSNDGTEASVQGDVYIGSLANSTTGRALVIGV